MYVKLDKNGAPSRYSIFSLRRDNPNVSFPRGIPPQEILSQYDVYPAFEEEEPDISTYNPATHKPKLEDAATLVDGRWTYKYYIAELSDQEKVLAYNNYDWNNRIHREDWLIKSDWTQIPDSSISPEKREEYRIWRQALRDITNNEKWPFLIDIEDWPTPPEGFIKEDLEAPPIQD